MNHAISLEKAIRMTTRYREQKDKLIDPAFAGKNVLPFSETFDRAAFDRLLSQPGCAGLRIYFGLNEEGQLRTIIVGVNEDQNDLLPNDHLAEDGDIVEDGKTCPPFCETDSPLMG